MGPESLGASFPWTGGGFRVSPVGLSAVAIRGAGSPDNERPRGERTGVVWGGGGHGCGGAGGGGEVEGDVADGSVELRASIC